MSTMPGLKVATMLKTATFLAIAMAATLRASAAEPSTETFAGAKSAAGTVFLDTNENGKMDPDEKGLSGIRVTAAREIVATDSEGKYKIAAKTPFYTVAVSFPDGMWPTGQWFARMSKDDETGVNFALHEDKQKPPMLFVQFTDPHNAHPVTMPMVRKDCDSLPIKPKFYICTGDMRSGDPSVKNMDELNKSFTTIGSNFEKFGAPLFMVPGNHDTVGYGGQGKAGGSEEAKHPYFANGCWEHYVCPSYWSFSCAGVHFVGIEYILWVDGQWNRFAPATAAWIQEDLKGLPAGTRTVVFTHDPGKAAEAVKKFGFTLGLAGDTHWVGRYFLKTVYLENVLAAGTCQTPVEKGKTKTTSDGYPQGYHLVVVEADRIDTFYKPLGQNQAIWVNSPHFSPKNMAGYQAPAAGPLPIIGQVYDPDGKLQAVKVTLGSTTADAKITHRRLWADFEAKMELKDVADFPSLCVTAEFPDGKYSITPDKGWAVQKVEK